MNIKEEIKHLSYLFVGTFVGSAGIFFLIELAKGWMA